MATKKAAKAPDDGRVAVKLPRIAGGEEQIRVSVNDYSCIIPRGQTVYVPAFIAEELARSEAAMERFYATKDALLEQSK